MTNRKKVRQRLEHIDSDIIFNDTIDNIIDKLSKLKTKHPDHEDFYISVERGWDSPDDFTLCGFRAETDAELNARLEREKKALEKKKVAKERAARAAITAKKNKEIKERKEYERLKKLFENK